MRAVVQRVQNSSIIVKERLIASIGPGLTVLLGIRKGDRETDVIYIMDKIMQLRIFPDNEGKMNWSLMDIDGEILLISQFTLYADARKGRRPGFSAAEEPDQALALFERAVNHVRQTGLKIKTGVFGADMLVNIENNGPCTILLDSEKIF
ncbi:MAG: D-tyrosyl-tRNA(Tyr) deacylase [Syntrophomonadaceae bacterium]|jgi:D-tyrosyl-tRNA(Tyr) deacylase|nr:D-tyrosyl-tRNA(Tyr) deacylase [Syntrophomonadaceae bacterium]